MDSALTAAAILVLITIGAYLIHRLNAQQAGRIAVRARRRHDRITQKQAH
ncbi:hypothetical protein ACYSUO_15780 [Streptomyces sp. UC4497]